MVPALFSSKPGDGEALGCSPRSGRATEQVPAATPADCALLQTSDPKIQGGIFACMCCPPRQLRSPAFQLAGAVLLAKLPMLLHRARLSNACALIDHSTRATRCHTRAKGLATGFFSVPASQTGGVLSDRTMGNGHPDACPPLLRTPQSSSCVDLAGISPEALGLESGWHHWDGL